MKTHTARHGGRRIALILILAACFVVREAEAQERVLITEFMAANTVTLRDQDRAYSDWIELFNAGSAPVNLEGWFLTDKLEQPTLWRFPAVSLAPNSHLVVFASGRNRQNPAGPLHTNFKLSADGEFLALVKPDGRTIASQFQPAYPPQVPDVSYGLDVHAGAELILPRRASKRVLVPSADPGPRWKEPGYDDSKWSAITGGLGFEAETNYAPLIGGNAHAAMF